MSKQFRNPFYFLLLIVGILFFLTATSYAVVAVRGLTPDVEGSQAATDFGDLVDRYGFSALMVELVILAAATVAAIATDQYWMSRNSLAINPTDQLEDEEAE